VPTGAKTEKIGVTTPGGTGSSGGNFTVSTVTAASLTSNPTSVSAGGSVTVSWANVSGPTTMDWIGLFTPGAANTVALSRIFDSSCATNAGSTANASGSCSFTLPMTAGSYQFRLLANNGYTVIATSGNVTVTGSGGGGATVTTNVSSISRGDR
jgi:hypothetical protein